MNFLDYLSNANFLFSCNIVRQEIESDFTEQDIYSFPEFSALMKQELSGTEGIDDFKLQFLYTFAEVWVKHSAPAQLLSEEVKDYFLKNINERNLTNPDFVASIANIAEVEHEKYFPVRDFVLLCSVLKEEIEFLTY